MILNEKAVASLTAPTGGRLVITDDSQRGLFIRVGKETRVWFLKRRGRWVKIGSWPAWSVAAARQRALELLALDEGGRAMGLTVTAAHKRWLSEKVSRSPLTVRNAEQILGKHFDDWKDKDLTKISRSDMVLKHDRIARASGPMAARNAMIAFRAWWRVASTLDPAIGVCPVIAVQMHRQKPQDESALYARLADWLVGIKTEVRSPLRREFYLIALLTGARRDSLRVARWEHLSDDMWTFPTPKRSRGEEPRPYSVPLLDEHRVVLARLRALRDALAPDSPWVFPAQRGKDHMTDVTLTALETKAWRTGGLPMFTPHSLRRVFISAGVEAGVHPYALSLLVNHRIDGTAGFYVAKHLPLRDAMASIMTVLMSRLGAAI